MARVGWCFHAILFFIILKFGGRQTMTLKEKNQIYKLREKGLSYSKIAKQTGFSESTIKSFFRRENLRDNDEKEVNKKCKYCGKQLVQTKGHRQKNFVPINVDSLGGKVKMWIYLKILHIFSNVKIAEKNSTVMAKRIANIVALVVT